MGTPEREADTARGGSMKKIRNGLLGLLVLAGSALTAGCMPARPATTGDLAERVYSDMRSISEGAQRYRAQHGALPEGNFWQLRSTLVLGGYIKEYPNPPAAIFAKEPIDYRIDPQYDTMDTGPDPDVAIAVWGLKDMVCEEYNRRYASDNSGATIFDWEANGKKYPGEAIGKHMTTYAIKWTTDAVDDCEINWVVEYR